MSNFGICSWEQFEYIQDGLYFNSDFRYGALLGTQVHHRSVLGNHKAWGVSGKLCISQNNHTMSILTGCAGDGKPLRIIGKPLKKAESR